MLQRILLLYVLYMLRVNILILCSKTDWDIILFNRIYETWANTKKYMYSYIPTRTHAYRFNIIYIHGHCTATIYIIYAIVVKPFHVDMIVYIIIAKRFGGPHNIHCFSLFVSQLNNTHIFFFNNKYDQYRNIHVLCTHTHVNTILIK